MEEQGLGGGRVSLRVSGMTCASCVEAVETALLGVPGAERAMVDLESGRAHFEGSARPVALVDAVEKAGYDARVARTLSG